MMRNSKPKIDRLTEELLEELQKLGFCKYYDSLHRPIDSVRARAFYKPYSVCGGVVRLAIDLTNKYVRMETPYDSWWRAQFEISEFIKDMDTFQKDLVNDLKALRKLGVIS